VYIYKRSQTQKLNTKERKRIIKMEPETKTSPENDNEIYEDDEAHEE
jgi:hypothetical protein